MSWKCAWSYLPIRYNTMIGELENITQRTLIRNNVTGQKLKLKFSNLYSEEPLKMEKVTVGVLYPNGHMSKQFITVTRNKEERIKLKAYEECSSDVLDFKVNAGEIIVLSIYFKEKQSIYSACSTWFAKSFQTFYKKHGDYTETEFLLGEPSRDIYPYVEADVNKATIVTGVCRVDIFTDAEVKTIVAFGDSITHMSYYSDQLLERFIQNSLGQVTIVNRGIGGNRILHDGTLTAMIPGNGTCFGTAAIKRFQRDVFLEDHVDAIIFLEGINDLMHPDFFGHPEEEVTSSQLIYAMRQIIGWSHEKGSKIYMGTIMPFLQRGQGSDCKAEKTRTEINEWIRTQKEADGVFDFDQYIQDELITYQIKDNMHLGDFLHPNELGGAKMCEAIDFDF